MISKINQSAQVSNISPAFQGKKVQEAKINLEQEADSVEFSTKASDKTKSQASQVKKIAIGASSMFVPGLGQLINGDGKSAAKHFFGSVGCTAGLYAGAVLAAANPVVGIGLAAVGGIGAAAISLHSIINAYKEA